MMGNKIPVRQFCYALSMLHTASGLLGQVYMFYMLWLGKRFATWLHCTIQSQKCHDRRLSAAVKHRSHVFHFLTFRRFGAAVERRDTGRLGDRRVTLNRYSKIG